MAKGVFIHHPASRYDDVPESRYQFPKRYLSRAREFIGDWILYYQPRKAPRMGYVATAKVASIEPDPVINDMFIAQIEPGSFLDFDQIVGWRNSSGQPWESRLIKPDGTLNGGEAQWSVRPISDQDFNRIVIHGLGSDELLPRVGQGQLEPAQRREMDLNELQFDHEGLLDRHRIETRFNRVFRDRSFRRLVLSAYDNTCAITGLRLINGGGRAEVEAAHIQPVAANGPDSCRNGIALSGTVHWMFDRGLISLEDDLSILVSRHVNDIDRVNGLIRPNRKALAPAELDQFPHPTFLRWHRENCFKQ